MGLLQMIFGRSKEPSPTPTNIGTGHPCFCECKACIDAFIAYDDHQRYTLRGLPIPSDEEKAIKLINDQAEYNRIAAKIGGTVGTHAGAMEAHKRVVRIMKGEEAEPE